MTRVLAALVGALLVADLVGVATVRGDDEKASAPVVATTSTTSTAAPSTAAATSITIPDRLAIAVQQLEAFVEQHRGLHYSRPVKVELLDDAAFRARLRALANDDNDELMRTGRVLTALGLLEPGVDLVKARDTLLSGAVIGLYDAKTGDLLVRGGQLNPFVRTTLSHELTHAAQDQAFHIDRPELDKRDDEASLGFSAVLEGDANRIEEEYRNSLSKAEQRQAAKGEAQAAGSTNYATIPPVLFQFLAFPYSRGRLLVDALIRAGGQARLDAAFKDPPTTSEQVLHPERFLAGEGPKKVADPAADGAVLDKGTMGEFVLQLMLQTAVSTADADKDAAGWGGDRYVAWDRGDKTCARVSFTMDSAADLQELRDGLSRWAAKQPDATITGTEPLTLTTCA